MRIYCPYCKKEKEYIIEKRDIKEFKGIEVNTFEEVAICSNCKNELYVNEIENENNKRIYEKYRENADIISSEDIINLREKYNISQRELTYILGFGKMTINRYERGEVPSKTQSDYLKLLINNEKEFIKKVKEAYKNNNITKKTYEKINSTDTTNKELNSSRKDNIENILAREPDIYNGYQELDLEKIENIISYIASKVKNLTITSINKYLWYIDMISFNKTCKAITGLTYEHEQFGPTILNRCYEDIALLNDKYKKENYESNYGTISRIESNNNYDLSSIDDMEIETIDEVIEMLKNKNVTEISEMSHKEKGWQETKRFENISFEYAMMLNKTKE